MRMPKLLFANFFYHLVQLTSSIKIPLTLFKIDKITGVGNQITGYYLSLAK